MNPTYSQCPDCGGWIECNADGEEIAHHEVRPQGISLTGRCPNPFAVRRAERIVVGFALHGRTMEGFYP